ncbi:substrate-binding domain-containing protein [Flectobacillus roseus]|uniref:substrate-binding domain-containing protein n=1 Tax=Flectobacillus roseus TaxID=502259 RepID=UPI0011407E18|nr:substrate-binding domain-containing protein [Flectobacillus roseus]MDI9870063.1 substrate-binding domain-containing protein [Flectobacillus roseus]
MKIESIPSYPHIHVTKPQTILDNQTGVASMKVLLVFNKLSDFKDKIYQSFLEKLGEKAHVDVYVHQVTPLSTQHFDQVIRERITEYDHVAVLLHSSYLHEDVLKTLNSIPKEKLLILDKRNEFIRGEYACVYHDFEEGIQRIFSEIKDSLSKYQTINLVVNESNTIAKSLEEGIQKFAKQYSFDFHVINEIKEEVVKPNQVFLILSEQGLADILKLCSKRQLSLGENIGIISYNETPLKEVLCGGISVVTINYEELGRHAANLILQRKKEHIKTPIRFIQRNSL